jgi:hypothetical protein
MVSKSNEEKSLKAPQKHRSAPETERLVRVDMPDTKASLKGFKEERSTPSDHS